MRCVKRRLGDSSWLSEQTDFCYKRWRNAIYHSCCQDSSNVYNTASQWLQILYSCRMLKSYTLIPVEKNKTNILKKYYTALLCSLCLTKIFQNHKLVFSLKNSKCLIARTKFYSPFIKGVKNNPVFPAGLQRLYLYNRALWQ